MDAGDIVSKELEPNERLLWSGMPRQGIFIQSGDAVLIPFSLMWGGFAFFWEYSVLKEGAPFFFVLWGIPFVLVGSYMMIGRFFHNSRIRRRTFYALTDKRALIIRAGKTQSIKALDLKGVTEIEFIENKEGSGTIIFGPRTYSDSRRGRSVSPRFESIDNARDVYRIAMDAKNKILSKA